MVKFKNIKSGLLFLLCAQIFAVLSAPSAQADSKPNYTNHCLALYSEPLKNNLVDCSLGSPDPHIGTIMMEPTVTLDEIKGHLSSSIVPLKGETREEFDALTAFLQRCYSEKCDLDPKISRDDLQQIIDILREPETVQAAFVQNFRKSVLGQSPRGQFTLFFSDDPRSRFILAYDQSKPINQVERFKMFEIFVWS